MRLSVITGTSKRAEAQAALQRALAPLATGKRVVTFRPGAMRVEVATLGPGRLWAMCEAATDESGERRYRNWFGILPDDPNKRLAIVVQCTVPVGATHSRVHGFFAHDPVRDRVYLMNDGTLGGGVKGIGRHAFLDWVGSDPVPAEDGEKTRTGLIVADLASDDVPLQIEEFVRRVATFKDLARAGKAVRRDPPSLLRLLPDDEYVGPKSGSGGAPVDYLTYHGAVVIALMAERSAQLGRDVEVGRTGLIDVLVARAGRLTEIYEVKTSLHRRSLYTAIGQLLVLGGNSDVRRVLVLPPGDLPADITETLARQQVAVRRFRRSEETGRITLLAEEPQTRL